MADDIEIVVRLDMGQAKAGIRELGRSKAQARRNRNQAATKRRSISRRVRSFAGAVAGFGLVSRIGGASAGNVDPWSEALTPLKAAAQEFLDEKIGFSAKAQQRAREDTANRFASLFAEQKDNAGFKEYYNTISRMTAAEEKGRNILRQDSRFVGPNLGELLLKAVPGYFKLIGLSFGYLQEALDR